MAFVSFLTEVGLAVAAAGFAAAAAAGFAAAATAAGFAAAAAAGFAAAVAGLAVVAAVDLPAAGFASLVTCTHQITLYWQSCEAQTFVLSGYLPKRDSAVSTRL